MKKLILILAIFLTILVGAYCGASWWVGTQARQQYDMMIAQNTNPYVEVKVQSYDRGVFHSRSVTTVAFKKPDAEPFRITIENSIQHGPLAFVKGPRQSGGLRPVMAVCTTRIAGEGEVGDLIAKALEKVPELRSSEVLTVFNLDGRGESYFEVPAFDKKISNSKGEEFMVKWEGLSARSSFDLALNEASGSFSVPGLDLRDKEIAILVKDLKGEFGVHPAIKDLMVGNASISCGKVEVSPADGSPPFRLDSFALNSESGMTGQTVAGSMRAGFEKLTVEAEKYGPFAMELEMRKLDAATLADFQRRMRELQAQFGVKTDEEMKELLEKSYLELATRLLAKSPEVELKQLKMSTARGDFDAKAKVSIAETGGSIMGNPLMALAALRANLDASASERLVIHLLSGSFRSDFEEQEARDPAAAERMAQEKARGIIDSLVAGNIIIRDAGTLKSNASYSPGGLQVNGRNLNLQEIFR